MPPTTTIASGFWACEPIEVASAAGNRPSAAVSEVMTTGRTRSSAPRITASRTGSPLGRIWLKYEIRSTPSCTATPKIEMKPTAAEIENGVPVSLSAQTPPIVAATTLTMTSSASFIELNAVYSRIRIRPIESGTIHISRSLASCIWANSPDQSMS